jgi:hypothetical protein
MDLTKSSNIPHDLFNQKEKEKKYTSLQQKRERKEKKSMYY